MCCDCFVTIHLFLFLQQKENDIAHTVFLNIWTVGICVAQFFLLFIIIIKVQTLSESVFASWFLNIWTLVTQQAHLSSMIMIIESQVSKLVAQQVHLSNMIMIIESQVSKSPRCKGWLFKFTCPTDHADVVLLLFCLLMRSIQPRCTHWSFYYWHVRDPDSSTRCSNCRITANCADHRKYWWMSDVVLALDIRRFLPKVWDRSILQTYDIFHPNCDINVQAVLHFLPPQCNVMVSLLTYVCRLFNVCSWDLWRPCCLLYKLHQRDNLSAPPLQQVLWQHKQLCKP